MQPISGLDPRRFRNEIELRELGLQLEDAVDTPQKWELIRKCYEVYLPEILAASKRNIRGWRDPNFTDWRRHLSPIENIAWDCIRGKYGIPFYPQFPAQNVFIDFANPYLKLGLELDGKDFHDLDLDKERDRKLYADGWQIFRVSGAECKRSFMDSGMLAERGIESGSARWRNKVFDWLYLTLDGVIQSIDIAYFRTPEERADCPFYAMAKGSLHDHTLMPLVDFSEY